MNMGMIWSVVIGTFLFYVILFLMVLVVAFFIGIHNNREEIMQNEGLEMKKEKKPISDHKFVVQGFVARKD